MSAYDTPINATAATFEAEVLNADLPVLVDFWAAWCGPCKAVAPVLEELARTHQGRLKIVKVDIDRERELAQAFGIRSIPTLLVIRDRKIADTVVGFPGARELEQRVAGLLGATA